MPDPRMAGKVAIITGAGSRAKGIGNGRAASLLLAYCGAKVMLVDQNEAWVSETQRMIEAEGGISSAAVADVAEPEDCRRVVRETVRLWGRLDVLVNNVGIAGPRGSAVDVDLDEWDRALRINVTSMMLMARYAVPEMAKSGGGSIVNLSSYAGLFGGHPNLLYPTSKGAIVNMTRAMAAHHAPQGIRVNAVAPGMVYTPMVYADGMSEELRAARRERSLLKTEGTGWDVGHAVLYLASDEARWVTGIVLPVDAGASAAPSASPVMR